MSRATQARRAVAVGAAMAIAMVGLVAPATAAGTGTIKGTVTVAAGLQHRGEVSLYSWSPALRSWYWRDWEEVGADGAFDFTGIEAGTEYTLDYYPNNWMSAGFAPAQTLGGGRMNYQSKTSSQVIQGSSGVRTVNFPLSSGVQVSGKVNVPAGVTLPVRIELSASYDWTAGDISFDEGTGVIDRAEVAPDGSYVFPRVIPGERYSVSVLGATYGGPSDHEAVSTGGAYMRWHPSALRLITGNTVLPTMTMKKTVPVTGKIIVPAGASAINVWTHLYEVDPAGSSSRVASIPTAADGSFSFPQGAFPGRSYTVEVNGPGGMTTYSGLSDDIRTAVTYRAGTTGLQVPDVPLIVSSGPDQTRWVDFSSVQLRGVPAVGSTLSVRGNGNELGGRTDTPGATITYQWVRDWNIVPGATGPEYKLTEADRHSFIEARMIVRAPGHRTDAYLSERVLVEDGHAPYATSFPVLAGAAKVGSRLSVSKGTWSVPNATLAYQWLRDGQPIAGAASSSYALTAADRGKRLSVRITAAAPGHSSGAAVTAPSAQVVAGDAAKVKKKPKIKGKKRVGKKLKVSKGTWSLKGVKVSYQWLRNGKKIKKATKKTYKLKKKDARKRISVRVTVKKAGYKNAKFVTKQTVKIKAKAKKR